jgi:O-antigen/teichoic acid export membrane protein
MIQPKNMNARLRALYRSVSLRHGLLMWVAMVLAGGLDYAFNILAGRWLQPVQFGIVVGVAAILQLLANLPATIRSVVAFYTVSLSVESDSLKQVGAFVQRAWSRAWQLGLVAMGALVLLSPFLARLLRFPNPWPLWAASPMLLVLFARPVTDGALQGMQAFARVGATQLTQSALRLFFAAGLIWLGGQAVGAIFALPLAAFLALSLARWWLRPYFRVRSEAVARPVSLHYSSLALLGVLSFAALANFDPLFVKHFYNPSAAGNYATVVTLAKISLYLPVALGVMLFPKAKLRQATRRDARPILLLALAGALTPGLALTAFYFLFPGWLVKTIFTAAYADPGVVLALASLAATLNAGLSIWLNYALALERPPFIYALIGVLAWQASGMLLFGRASLVHMTMVMVSAGIMGNVAGFITTWYSKRTTTKVQAELAQL